MHPTLLEQLSHPGVDEWVTRQAILPLFQLGVVCSPWNREANGIIFDLIKVSIHTTHCVEIFPPDELTGNWNQRRSFAFVDGIVEIVNLPVKSVKVEKEKSFSCANPILLF